MTPGAFRAHLIRSFLFVNIKVRERQIVQTEEHAEGILNAAVASLLDPCSPVLLSLEILHRAFVFFGRSASIKRSEILSFARFRILLAGIETVLARR
jgi:hypothetical protein